MAPTATLTSGAGRRRAGIIANQVRLKSGNILPDGANIAQVRGNIEPKVTKSVRRKNQRFFFISGPCTKDGTDYYWCRRGPAYDSIDNWDYCSPDFGITRYELKCKSDHQCSKHDNKEYFWCFVEANDFGWTWDYCSPPFDLFEFLDDSKLDFVGNFNFPGDQGLQQSRKLTIRSEKASGSDWPGYPFLYRILAGGRILTLERDINEGNGFNGLLSRSRMNNRQRPTINQRIQVPLHVGQNRFNSPWISTSADLDHQDRQIRTNVRRRWDASHSNSHQLFLVTIDARYIDERVVNLIDDRTANALLSSNQRALNFARNWNEVLIYWSVPSRAIKSSRRYFFNQYTKQVEMQEFSNPNYCHEGTAGCKDQRPKFEDFDDEDRSYGGGYPNYL